MTPDEKRARLSALTRLALATREKAEPQTLQVYLDMTATWPILTLERACERLGRTSEWFPKVAEITAECASVARVAADRREEQQRLSVAPPVPEARQRELLHSLADLVKRRAWPTDRRGA